MALPKPSSGHTQTFKVVLLGEAGVGKSALFLRMRDGTFRDNRQPTLGIESCTKAVVLDGGLVDLQVWDTAGVERYKTLTRNYYRNSHAILLVYSLDNPASLLYLSKWIDEKHNFAPDSLLFLFGNKSDLERAVYVDSVEDFAEAHDIENAFFVSAKSGAGLEEALSAIAQKLVTTLCCARTITDSIFDDSINYHTSSTRSNRSTCEC